MAENEIPDFGAIGRVILADAITYASVTGLNFFKESFENQGWTDGSFTPWKPTQSGRDGASILTNTGFLRDSLQIVERRADRIEYAATAPYAGIHNEGGVIAVKVTAKSRRFFWYMYYTNVDKSGNVQPGGSASSASMWKAMALTKKSFIQVRIPKRQFIGESQTLMNSLDKWVVNQITERFNNAI